MSQGLRLVDSQLKHDDRSTSSLGRRALLRVVAMLLRCMAGSATTVLLTGVRTEAFRPSATFWGVQGDYHSR